MLITLGLFSCSCAPGAPASVSDLTTNERAFVEWIPLERVETDSITPIDATATEHLTTILQRVADAHLGGGEITDAQISFSGSLTDAGAA